MQKNRDNEIHDVGGGIMGSSTESIPEEMIDVAPRFQS